MFSNGSVTQAVEHMNPEFKREIEMHLRQSHALGDFSLDVLVDATVWSIEEQWLHGALSIFRSKGLDREKAPTEETREMGEALRE